jgi:hypothetical protein
MFFVKEIPVVIEPGVAILEAEMTVVDNKAGERTVVAHFFRVPLDDKVAPALPLVPTTQHPHVFSLHEELDRSPLLLVYDQLGRLSLVYHRDPGGKSWERKEVLSEHAGKTVTQFSVRFCFSGVKERNKFLTLMTSMMESVRGGGSVNKAEMTEAVTLLSRSRVAPVVLPIAVARSKMKNVRIV